MGIVCVCIQKHKYDIRLAYSIAEVLGLTSTFTQETHSLLHVPLSYCCDMEKVEYSGSKTGLPYLLTGSGE